MKFKCLLASLSLVVFAACSDRPNIMSTGVSPVEMKTLASNPFDPASQMTSVDDSEDAFIPNLVMQPANHPVFVSRCTKERYELEKAAALDAARKDPNHSLIPIRYAVSVGSLFDDLAYWAHRRSILRVDSDMTTPVAVAPANNLQSSYYNGANSLHYFVDHSQARKDFIDGTHCYFDVVKVKSQETGHGIYLDGKYNHAYNILYYGDTYDPNDPNVKEGMVSPRLFQPLDQVDYTKQDPQIIPLYVADLRNGSINTVNTDYQILNPDFVSSAVRRKEYTKTFKEIFRLRTLWTYRDPLTKILSTNRNVEQGTGVVFPDGTTCPNPVYRYSAYENVPQLIDWLVFSGLDATMMSTQYTPLVLDLGTPNIRTSSVAWGTFFNLAGLKDKSATDPDSLFNVSHLTAWLGGYVRDTQEPNSVNIQTLKRRAEDGFLVIPNADGTIGPDNLFGSSMPITVNGQQKTFTNGFDTLAALAHKNCESANLKDHYVGPWDGDLFSKTLKVWVDADRNGVAGDGEVMSLVDARVGAINVCFRVYQTVNDRFGNTTNFRAAFLLMAPGESIIGNEREILSRLTSGVTSAGAEADFRVMIDILFQANPNFYLENIDPSNIAGL